ncbi:anthranilate synthase component II [Desulfobotulus mexicanus]|uniref:Aminodeoxychorismate/anthranilate synthase component II n=1 Tax=Desulfobotulus mexicanus TaxID=2586642 RepID=A0A5Q4VC44_9BACT|nr:aminodeoxychorismate/anthranilate synthase component II [Desulfobotulus mexicanus]TYT75274.1 aminodeoxychorismate/anthranilate synthase component II [Desulfobotulus mexicanus]
MKPLILIDNFDSFTFNLVQLFAMAGQKPLVLRSNTVLSEIIDTEPAGIIIGPGPDDPRRSGVSMEVLEYFSDKIPILGICLGMQCIAEHFGGKTILSPEPVHGKTSMITHEGRGVLENIPSPFTACRYHSLCVEIPEKSPLCICGRSEDGTPMALFHRDFPLFGLQFHPESFLSEYGHQMALNFLGVL